MAFRSLALLAAISSVSLAATPEGFEPASQNALVVTFGAVTAMGSDIDKADAQSAPSIGTLSQLDGTSFAVMMIDIDVPTDAPPATNTLLHWLQTGLKQSTSATDLGGIEGYALTASDSETPLADYFGPNPPARIPLSHRYTQILVDTSSATDATLAILEEAASTRSGFDAVAVLEQAGLSDKVVAGNYFIVTNTGPTVTRNETLADPFATDKAAASSGFGVGPAYPTSITPGAAARDPVSLSLLGLAAVAALCACL